MFRGYFDSIFDCRPWQPLTHIPSVRWYRPWVFGYPHETASSSDTFKMNRTIFVSLNEEKGIYTVEADIPGYVAKDVKVSYKDETLFITAENEARGKATAEIYLDRKIDLGRVACNVTSGVLVVKAPIVDSQNEREFEVF